MGPRARATVPVDECLRLDVDLPFAPCPGQARKYYILDSYVINGQ